MSQNQYLKVKVDQFVQPTIQSKETKYCTITHDMANISE